MTKRTSNTQVLINDYRRATSAALVAGGTVIQKQVIESLEPGYLSSLGNQGDFVTGNSLDHVFLSDPEMVGDVGVIRVYTDLWYLLYWELGHYNILTRHYERDERWSQAYRLCRGRAVKVVERTFKTSWGRRGARAMMPLDPTPLEIES